MSKTTKTTKSTEKKVSALDEALQLLEQRNAELAVISSVQQGLAAEMDMQGIYDLVGDQIRNVFDAQVAAVATFNFENQTEEFQYIFEDGERFKMEPRPIDKVRQRLIDTQDVLCINENADEVWSEITGEAPTVVPGTKLTKSALYVPMKVGNDVRGYVSLQNLDREHAFSKSDIQLLTTLTNSMSVALENALLFNETEQRNAELAVINSVQEGLVAEMDMQGIYDLVGDKTRELFDSQVTVIGTFDHENGKELFNYVYEDGKRFYPEARAFDNIRTQLIKKNKLISIQENAADAVKKLGVNSEALPGTKFPKTMVYVPLAVGDTVRGYVSLQNLDRENAFSDSDIRLLSTLANSMSIALENARLFNEAEQRNAELAVINSVQEGLVAEMDLQGIYDLVGDKTRELFDSQVTLIGTFDHENQKEIFNYLFEDGKRFHLKPRPLDKIRERLIKTKKLIDIRENSEEAYTTITGKKPESVPGTSFAKSMVYVPLLVGDSVRGYVSLQNIDRE
ncbi:MAG: GAF domain-containing protein, partial [Aquaticitalea sp.]